MKKDELKLKVKKLNNLATLPQKAHSTDAGFDLFTYTPYRLGSHSTEILKTGLAVEIPEGYCGIIKDRSSIASKSNLKTVAGVIDSSYRGEIGIVFHNDGEMPINIEKGQKIAQMLIVAVPPISVEEVTELTTTERNTNGFGSTGK